MQEKLLFVFKQNLKRALHYGLIVLAIGTLQTLSMSTVRGDVLLILTYFPMYNFPNSFSFVIAWRNNFLRNNHQQVNQL